MTTKKNFVILPLVVFFFFSLSSLVSAVIAYKYDELHRLVRVEHPDGKVTTYEYDDLGNRTSMITTTSLDFSVMTQNYNGQDYFLAVGIESPGFDHAEVVDGPNIVSTWENHAHLSQRPNIGDVYTIWLCYDTECNDYEVVTYAVTAINDNFATIISPADGAVVDTDTFPITWQAAPGTVTGYSIVVCDEASNCIWGVGFEPTTTSTTYNFDGSAIADLQPDKPYNLHLHSYDENGNQATTVSTFYPFSTPNDTDDDGDGFTENQGDCNDSDATINPDAEEICDGKDNDCNESTADGAIEPWIGDACDGPDNDQCLEGSLVCSFGVQVCSDETGDNVETCDGIDNDCDGQVDEDVTTTFYQDADYDGYGNPAILINDCLPPAGYVADNTDCDDDNSSVYPGAPELCDSKDNQCPGDPGYGEIDEGCPELPSPPTNLSATYDSANDLNWITWNAVAEATEYHVYWGTDTPVTKSSNMLAPTSSTEYNHTGVEGGYTYYYRVAAENSAGESALSAEASVYVPPEDFPVFFPDPNLEATIREAISKPTGDIMYSDLQDLTFLYAMGRGIIELEGLQYCTNLSTLQLPWNQITDISPLTGLVNLSRLSLDYNQITDISPLTGLVNLSHVLYLDSNQITDISPLIGLVNLSGLSLESNQITDISPLTGLVNLAGLYLGYNQISDISPLAGLTNLGILYLRTNQISDISVLAGLVNLSELSLESNQISDISVLAGLVNLKGLYLESNQITDISPLTGLVNLSGLSLYSNQISDISPLAGLTNLSLLYLNSNQINDISALAGLVNLGILYLRTNQITDISALAGLVNLSWLDLYDNHITDISPLVDNLGIGNGDLVDVRVNLLDSISCPAHIPELETRGVIVYHDCVQVDPHVSSTSGVIGDTLSQPGWGFTPNGQAELYFRHESGAEDTPITKQVGPDGTYDHFYTIPEGKLTGTWYYWAKDLSSEILSPEVSFTISLIDFPVNFPDPNLDAAIREAINKPEPDDIMYSDLEDLTDLIAQFRGIIELEGLQYCLNLFRLYLDGNQISNISPLAGLTNLSYLGLFGNQITDISPLAGLTNLSDLQLSDNQIADISVLAGLTNLSRLVLDSNQITDTDISILAGLTNLSDLGLGYNQITDISVLAGLTNLRSLYLNSTQITDISVLAGFTNLRSLSLGSLQITDISVLAGLTDLDFLYLGSNQITDISVLAGLTNLRSLYLNSNQITDISVLAGLTNLMVLRLYGNQITDISVLAGLTNLRELNLNSNQITDISVLAGLTNLRWLTLSSNQITDISPLVALNNLSSLGLSNNQISNISVLAALTNLSELGLSNNQISDISPLVSNSGIGTGDSVNVSVNPLDAASCTVHIPELESRGATVYHDCP